MNEKIDDIITRLQAQQPELKDADQLTDRIMASLPDISQEEETEKPSYAAWIVYLRAASSVAAIFLIVFTLWHIPGFGNPAIMQTTNDYEQCIAKYESDYSSLKNYADYKEALARLEQMKNSHPSIINQLKETYYENK
jgi:hypothetical protein